MSYKDREHVMCNDLVQVEDCVTALRAIDLVEEHEQWAHWQRNLFAQQRRKLYDQIDGIMGKKLQCADELPL